MFLWKRNENTQTTGDFSESDKIKCLLWCDRHSCLCGKACGSNIEVHHITPKEQGGTGDIDDAIPFCFDCHNKVGCYKKKTNNNIYQCRSL